MGLDFRGGDFSSCEVYPIGEASEDFVAIWGGLEEVSWLESAVKKCWRALPDEADCDGSAVDADLVFLRTG